jgi:uncharacterized membrane protein YqiK
VLPARDQQHRAGHLTTRFDARRNWYILRCFGTKEKTRVNWDPFVKYWWAVAIVLVLLLNKLIFRLFGAVIIPQDSIGVVNKKYVLVGRNRTLPDGCIVALNGEAGIQADTLAPGVHFGFYPWQYEIKIEKFVTIGEGRVGVVESRDGKSLSAGRVLARRVDCDSFQDARKFLSNGGERGPQITVIPPGTYRINSGLFTVVQEPVLEIEDNMVGVVTTREGRALPTGDIAGGEIPGHNMFQDAQAFIDNGGFKGLQEQVMLAGRYFINPRFATVATKPMTEVPIANAGVVIAFVGDAGVDVTGDSFKHGNLVARGQKGVWVEPLDPGKYPINPYTHRVENVPTANVVLNWATGKTEAHKLDANLCTITVRSSDGFTFNLDVSQIIHIPRNDAPKVIARFGSMMNLVTQVLEPTIGNYFRNAAQGSDVIEFLKQRQQRQADAREQISAALRDYNVGAVDTLIGDITPPDALMKTLTDRKLAEQEKVTYETQRLAEQTRKELQKARAEADTQANVVTAQRKVEIADYDAQSTVKKAGGDAQSRTINATADAQAKTINAAADAEVLRTVGAAEGMKITAVGEAEARVIQLKTDAVGQGNYAVIEVGKALAGSGFKLVPDVVAGGSGDGGRSGVIDVLMAGLLRDSLNNKRPGPTPETPQS